MKNKTQLVAMKIFNFIVIPIYIVIYIFMLIPFIRNIIDGKTAWYSAQSMALMSVFTIVCILMVCYLVYVLKKRLTNPKYFQETIIKSTDERGESINKKAAASSFWVIFWLLCSGAIMYILVGFIGYYYWHLWGWEEVLRISLILTGVVMLIIAIYYIYRAYYERNM